jgi:hypothetical protein
MSTGLQECRVSYVYIAEIAERREEWRCCNSKHDALVPAVYLLMASVGGQVYSAPKCHFCLVAALLDLIPSMDAEMFRQCYTGDRLPPLFITEP